MWKRDQGLPEESLLRLWDFEKGLPIQEVRSCCQRVVSCLKAIAAIALLVKDADKLTLGQQMTIVSPHALESII